MPQDFDPYHRWLGIHPEEQPASHYRMLGLAAFESDPETIRDAAAQRMAHVRTYQLGPNSVISQQILNELGAAKACLLNPQKKTVYDEQLRAEQLRAEISTRQDYPPAPPALPPPLSEHLRAAISTRQGAAVSPPPELDSEGTETVPGLDIPELGSMGAHHHPSKKKQPPWLIPAVVGGGVLVCLGVMAAMLTGDWGQSKQAEQSSPATKREEKAAAAVAPKEPLKGEAAGASTGQESKPQPSLVLPGKPSPVPAEDRQKSASHWKYALVPQEPSPAPAPSDVTTNPSVPTTEPPVASVPDQPTAASSHASEEDKPSEALTDRVPVTSPSTIGVAPGGGLGRGKRPGSGRFPARRYEPPPTIAVKLPSGFELNDAVLGVPRDWLDRYFPSSQNNVYAATYSEGKIQGVFHYDKLGRLDGHAATLYETGELETMGFYTANSLQGPLRVWDNNTQRLVYAEYKKGKKQGVCCLFRDGLPWVVQDFDKGQVQSSYLVKFTGVTPAVRAATALSDPEKKELESAEQKLNELEEQMADGQQKVKKVVSVSYQKLKQARASRHSVAAREADRQRDAAAHDAEMRQNQDYWRRALKGSGF
ncbi:MAG: hypothetical protein ACLQNE_25485 [Thermoguttaceae bacterium]|jgi:hypothetical protein